ncbi:aldehyde dehydrogenase (NADP(+)) [Chryseolinea sp. T2]|uniref:aldehyde dehydrogenase (NADP(+)) n=1 Tax=Chryseolinea sp. T2 TaxID=3129255 RepID=UPI003077DE32
MDVIGKQLIRGSQRATGKETFASVHAATGSETQHTFYEATDEEINDAVEAAVDAFETYGKVTHAERAKFLRTIAKEIEQLGDMLLETASSETGLGLERLRGERGRTMNQLNAFASFIEDGSWLRIIIDRADPERKPLPKPDLRQMQVPIGPVAVFGASNFPLAFSVAGGDTAAALASGCPVVFKAHPAHPATCELAATAIMRAVEKCELPAGTFSMLHGRSNRVGGALVTHPHIKAVAFTGSFRGGKALFDQAVRRPEPIPVYAEMGSVNPVLILPSVAKRNRTNVAKQLAGSITLGSGQFCTNPGLLMMSGGDETQDFLSELATELATIQPATMLTSTICNSYIEGIKNQRAVEGVKSLTDGPSSNPSPHLAWISAADAVTHPHVLEEVFGPSSMAVVASSMDELLAFAKSLPGQLTATVLGEESEIGEAAPLIDVLRQKVGRIIFNGYPTGVEVSPAMVHGGPYPATTDARSTSVGTTAIYRFTRPVCFQNFPQQLLPAELRD